MNISSTTEWSSLSLTSSETTNHFEISTNQSSSVEDQDEDDEFSSNGKRIAFVILLSICFILSIILNSILLVVFARRRSFRKEISNRLLMNLIVLNCFSTLVLDPLFFLDIFLTSSLSDSIICGLSSFISVGVAAISMYSQFLIALDQYMAVVTPLKYTNRVNRIRCVLLCASAWVWGLLCGLAFSFTSEIKIFESSCKSDRLDLAPNFLNCLFNFIFPLSGLIIFYRRIFTAARDNTIRTRRNSSIDGLSASNNNINLLTPNSPCLIVEDSSSSNNNNNNSNNNTLKASMKTKITHASAVTLNLILHPESTLDGGKAAKIILLSLNAICITWVPFFFVHFIVSATSKTTSSWLLPLSMISVASAPVLSPILYAFRSRRVRKEIRLAFRGTGQTESFGGNGFNYFNSTNSTGKKMRRLRSFSCPQLLITSFEDQPIHLEVKSKSIFSNNDGDVRNLFKKAIFQQRFNNSHGDDLSKRRSTLPVPDETHGMIPNVCSFPTSLEYANSLSPRLSRRRN
ncbi:uncharacterized protein [Lepeophtheirus salmonis]|uniref:uncharacterized protein isoform X1 n=2 Tax=Lepeophtheirus salmonis TaxID=72036 RepID=UPI001AE84811|nr:5-hydroxytryptamine receptor 1E-like isoform X3 [Lepeophtheirus salmonis]